MLDNDNNINNNIIIKEIMSIKLIVRSKKKYNKKNIFLCLPSSLLCNINSFLELSDNIGLMLSCHNANIIFKQFPCAIPFKIPNYDLEKISRFRSNIKDI